MSTDLRRKLNERNFSDRNFLTAHLNEEETAAELVLRSRLLHSHPVVFSEKDQSGISDSLLYSYQL